MTHPILENPIAGSAIPHTNSEPWNVVVENDDFAPSCRHFDSGRGDFVELHFVLVWTWEAHGKQTGAPHALSCFHTLGTKTRFSRDYRAGAPHAPCAEVLAAVRGKADMTIALRNVR